MSSGCQLSTYLVIKWAGGTNKYLDLEGQKGDDIRVGVTSNPRVWHCTASVTGKGSTAHFKSHHISIALIL